MKYPDINPHLALETGEKICNKCNGWGYIITERQGEGLFGRDHKLCSKCLGKCMLDWIDAAIGKNRDPRWV